MHTQSSSPVNEALTKKKFCQSVKLFHEIFGSEKRLHSFQRHVFKVRKMIFSVVFCLFMEALPPDTATRLPRELWEKVWKFTQNPYLRQQGQVPLMKDTTYYRAGLRAEKLTDQLLEKVRANFHYAYLNRKNCILEYPYGGGVRKD